jgi:Fuc2NAc and GlcNAc transferase
MSFTLLLILTVLAACAGAACINRNASRLRLIEVPNHRSSHIYPKSSGGGIAIALAGSIAAGWLAIGKGFEPFTILILALLLAGVGLWDDIQSLPVKLRFGIQILVGGALLWVYGVPPILVIDLFQSSMGSLVLQDELLLVLIMLTGLWWINLFNFMDGIDGIAGAQAVFMLASAAGLGVLLFPETVSSMTWHWMLIIMSATFGFLILNWPPARIFMGDAGSTYLGFMIFALAMISVREGWLDYPAWLILGALFISDTTITLLRRMLARERWFEAHRTHAYQRLEQRLNSHLLVTLLAIAINVLWLLPLTWMSLVQPQFAWHYVAIAYTPLLVGVVKLGAQKERSEQHPLQT